MKLKSVLLVAGLVAAAGGVSAIAAVGEGGFGKRWGMGEHHGRFGGMMGHGKHGGGGLLQLDTDKDGDVTLAEFLKPREARFAELDANKDGVVDAAELTAYFKAKAGDRIDGMLKRLDANGDGRISREEFALAMAGGMRHGRGPGHGGRHGHHRMGDRGGMMDGPGPMLGERMGEGPGGPGPQAGKAGEPPAAGKSAEAQPGEAAPAEKGDERGWRGRHRRGESDRGGGRAAFVAGIESRFKELDKNNDGFIDKAELEAAQTAEIDYRVKRMLHSLDRNKDGKVTAEEFLAPAKERFAKLDLNDDGKITADDLPPSRRGAWSKR